MSKSEWVSQGSTGRMRNPDWARTPEQVIESAKAAGRDIAYLLDMVRNSGHPYQSLWYQLQNAENLIKHARAKLEDDLFQLGVLVPEKFDFSALRELKKTTPKKKSTRKK